MCFILQMIVVVEAKGDKSTSTSRKRLCVRAFAWCLCRAGSSTSVQMLRCCDCADVRLCEMWNVWSVFSLWPSCWPHGCVHLCACDLESRVEPCKIGQLCKSTLDDVLRPLTYMDDHTFCWRAQWAEEDLRCSPPSTSSPRSQRTTLGSWIDIFF